ncbi:MAG: lamin tail domain-containing protein [Verrucomicrobia subdivision 3 bacterium]|nr:lamin tail domain-containing protein [Limisphaerales bacterium]
MNVLFSEGVSGVEAGDLRINGVGASSVTEVSPREYQFNFPQPATGLVTVAWAASPGIADLDLPADPFVPGPGWSYTLDPSAITAAVIISEFMADNENGIEDEDGTKADWIELYNRGTEDVNLGGWFLTDTVTNLTKWRFPDVPLAVNRYLLVWASQKNKTNAAAPLHTNFRLSNNSGSYLALVDPQTNVVSEFVSYPAQQNDVSYGRDRVDPNIIGYFTTPTPGVQNSTSGTGFAPEPVFSLESGTYTNNSLTLNITAPAGTTIRFTRDGTEPTANSPVFSNAITFSTNLMVKARVFQTGLFPSAVRARSFIMLDNSTREFNSNVPIMIISTHGRTIPANVPPGGTRARGVLASIDTFRGRSELKGEAEFVGLAQFEVTGQTSADLFPKKPHRIEVNDEVGNDLRVSLLGMPAEADWILRNPYSDKCLMNDFLGYELWEEMGHYSCRRRFVELFVDTGGGKLSYPGDYYGVMVLFERIEAGNNRVDIAELTPSHTNEPAITGGYIIKKDKDSTGDLNFSTPGGAGHSGQGLKLHSPRPSAMRAANPGATTSWPGPGYTPSASNQLGYLLRYLNRFEASIYAANWTNLTGTNHYSHYIDVDAFVDQHLHVEFTKQIDGYRLSSFYSKDRNGKLKPEPVWDWNLSFGNANYLKGGMTNGWYWADQAEGMGSAEHIWLRRLVFGSATVSPSGTANGPGDPDFRQKITDRWGVLRTNVLNGNRVVARIDELATLLTEAAVRNYAKYPILNTQIWPNPEGGSFHVDYTQPTYAAIISEMKKWTMGRFLWMDNQFLRAPVLSSSGGPITPGFSLVASATAGTIYYTLDGSDPRLPGGRISPTAVAYSGPITINTNSRVVARAYLASTPLWTQWSPPSAATFVAQTPRLVITEIMYHPLPPGPGSTNIDEDFEYLELKNVGGTTLNVNGFSISGGVDFTFPNRTLAVGERVLVVKNRYAFTNRYGTAINSLIAGEYAGNLANDGNRLILEGRVREPILDFSYDDEWYPITDGFGFSLVVVDESAAASAWGTQGQWRPSGTLNGTPGQGDTIVSAPQVVINEALTHSDPAPPFDTIELRNLGATPANIGGWFLTDDFREPKKYRIPTGTMIPENGYLTFDESVFNSGPTAFSLSSHGDEVYLFSGDIDGNLTGYYHGHDFGAAPQGVTFGRHVNSVGVEHFVAQVSPTLPGANSGPRVGPVVISEIMYHPPDVFVSNAYWNNPEDEYIELHNFSAQAVPLNDPMHATNTWTLTGAVDFTFPQGVNIPAGGYIIVAGVDPANSSELAGFRARNGISASVPVYGAFKGNLSNESEPVELRRPDVPEPAGPPDFGFVPYVLVERVRYSDMMPWPVAADGIGPSLQRITPSAYGNDPANWVAAAKTPGAAFGGGMPPTIVQQPTNRTVVAFNDTSLHVVASGANLSYQWRFNSANLVGETNATLNLINVLPNQEGYYQVVVLNPSGSIASSNVFLEVLIPANIVSQPQNVIMRGSTNEATYGMTFSNAVFAVVANSSTPITYQWRYNSNTLAGATNNTLVVSNVNLSHQGFYDCIVTDGIGSVRTTPALLRVNIVPVITRQPQSIVALAGDNIAFSFEHRGTAPFGYRWRRNGVNLFPGSGFTNLRVLTISNVQTNQAGTYTVIITNAGNMSPGVLSANAVLTVLVDSDGDGAPDIWESQFGFLPNNGSDGELDFDGDGASNADEFRAGTDPKDENSYLGIASIAVGGETSLTFPARSNRSYMVEYKDAVGTSSWTRLANVYVRTNNHTAVVLDTNAPGPQRYYRVVTPLDQN